MDFSPALENIYISPLESCNLNCRLCYTKKTHHVLTNQAILSFVKRYRTALEDLNLSLKSILFCGGEVFISPRFTTLINKLNDQGIFVTVITNGTIDRLDRINSPNNCQLLVSFDGPEKIHDDNRGLGNFAKSSNFVRHARDLGFPVEIMYLVTPQSYPYIDNFSIQGLPNNFITQKTYFYTANHPLSNQKNLKPALTKSQIIKIKQNYPSLPAKNFGCFQFSLQSNGQFYGCCESPNPLGKLSDRLPKVIKAFKDSLNTCSSCSLSKSKTCFGCTTPKFLCGYIHELKTTNCLDVVRQFNNCRL